jgi:hypothetical protein
MTLVFAHGQHGFTQGDWMVHEDRRTAGGLILLLTLAACSSTPESRRPPPPPPTLAGPQCLAQLRGLAPAATPTTFPKDGPCSIDTPVRVKALDLAFQPAVTMSCGLAKRLAEFDQRVVQPAARRRWGVGAVTLLNFGTYNCRPESSGGSRISQHGFGRAIDVSGFVLADGTRISVERDWEDDGPNGEFIHEVARAACDYFSVVLTPDSNADHHNHLHLDVGPERLCGPA